MMHGAEDAQVSTADAEKLFNAIGEKDSTLRVFTPTKAARSIASAII